MKGLIKSLFKGKAAAETGANPLTYEEARRLARDEALDVRRDLAARSDVEPEILYFLAEDPAPEVRRQIAVNTVTPVHADLLLASDDDEHVRGDLAGKIAALAPGLSADEQDKVRQMTYQVLEALARDQATRVRQILSDALKDIADAPPDVIRKLASDAELVVSGPVLQYSPVLTEDDLREILETNPSSGNLSAVSRRESVPATLADVIIATYDEEAVALLLANPSAQIREEMLDRIIDRALDIEPWHEPLVHRPLLPGRAAAKLARFVAHNLLDNLKAREDLEPEVLEEVRQVVEKRLREGPPERPEEEKTSATEALEKVTALKAKGMLDEAVVADALKSGEREISIAALAVLSGLKVAVVRAVITNRSAKGMVAIAWKAGMTAKLAETLQQKLALVQQKEVLKANGPDYPLDDDAMEWQLDFIKDLA